MASFKLREKNGQWHARIYDPARQPTRIERSLRTTDQAVARRKLTELEREVSLGEFDPWTEKKGAAGLTWGEAREIYERRRSRYDTDATMRTRGSRFNVFGRWLGPETAVRAIRASDVEDFLAQLDGRSGGAAAEATLESYYGSLSGMWSWLVEEGHVEDHIFDNIPRPQPRGDSFHVLSVRELQAIRRAIIDDTTPAAAGEKRNRHRLRRYLLAVVDFTVSSGLRIGQVCALRWQQVRLQACPPEVPPEETVAIVRVQSYRGRADARSNRTKTEASQRRLPVYPRGAYVLWRQRERYRENNDGDRPPGSRVVFRSAWGRPALAQTITSRYAEYVEASGIDTHTVFHDLRHTYISWMVNELAVPLPVAQQLAGHASPERTRSYAHVSYQNVRESIGRAFKLAGVDHPFAEDAARADSGMTRVARFLAGHAEVPLYFEPGTY